VFWLVDGSNVLGLVSIRHRLTKGLRAFGGHIGYVIRPSARRKGYGTRILKLALSKARQLRLKRVLLTCSPYNVGSRKIIERNGGVFRDRARSKQGTRLRYWIAVN
jgi:predicted acetyltransferase